MRTEYVELNVTVATSFPEDIAGLIAALREERVAFTFSTAHGPIEIVSVEVARSEREETRG